MKYELLKQKARLTNLVLFNAIWRNLIGQSGNSLPILKEVKGWHHLLF